MEDNLDSLNQGDEPEIEQNSGAVVDGDDDAQGKNSKDDPYSVKKRLGQQAKKHEREMRALRDQMAQLQNGMNNRSSFAQVDVPHENTFNSPGQPNGPSESENDRIQRAVRYALEAKAADERKARDAESAAKVNNHYSRLRNEFDNAMDKYDDFEDVVMRDDVPFSPAMRDAMLLIDNPADVAYKLGKNKEELSRIAKLHPLEQAREVNKLSFALMQGNNGQKADTSQTFNPMQKVRPNPVTSGSVTDKTPASAIRARMKAGTWK